MRECLRRRPPTLRPTRRGVLTVALAALWATAAAPPGARGQEPAALPSPPETLPVVETEAAPGARAEPAQDSGPAPYVLNSGDLIEIKSPEDPSLNEQARIGPDGMISHALAGYVRAAGRTLEELDEVLTAELRSVVRDPKITIFVREYSSQIVYVGGEVEQPKEVRITGHMNALAAVFAAGGFTDGANRNRVILVRRAPGGGIEKTALDLERDPDAQTELHGFDVLVVPPTAIAQADLYVEQYVNRIVPNALNVGFSYIFGNTALR